MAAEEREPEGEESLTDDVRDALLKMLRESEQAEEPIEETDEPTVEEERYPEMEIVYPERERDSVALPREMLDEKEKYRRPDGTYDIGRWYEDQRRRWRTEPPPR